jgi:hypothetical protein
MTDPDDGTLGWWHAQHARAEAESQARMEAARRAARYRCAVCPWLWLYAVAVGVIVAASLVAWVTSGEIG